MNALSAVPQDLEMDPNFGLAYRILGTPIPDWQAP